MPSLNKIKTIFSMEWKKFFQNKKNVITTLIAGPLMVILLLFLISQIPTTDPKIEIYSNTPVDSVVVAMYPYAEIKPYEEDVSKTVSATENMVAIVNRENSIDIYYNSSMLSTKTLINEAKKIATNIAVMGQTPDAYTTYEQLVNSIQVVNMNQSNEDIIDMLLMILSMLFMLSLMTVNATIGGMSVDAICGEKERGSYDTLKLSGTNTSSIVLGKLLFVMLIGFIVLVVNGAAVFTGLYTMFEGADILLDALLDGRLFWFAPFFMLFAGIAILETSLFFAIASTFDKVKQAMSYMGIVQILLSMLTYLPNVVEEKMLASIPIANLSVIMKSILNNESCYICSLASLMICVTASIFLFGYSIFALNNGEEIFKKKGEAIA